MVVSANMAEERVYSKKQFTEAVNLAAFFGWISVSIWISLFPPNIGVYFLAFFIGAPIAYLSAWVIGAPILKRLMRKPIGWYEAALWGGLIAALIRLPWLLFLLFMGFRQSNNPRSWSQVGGGDYIRSVDGVLTKYGWLMEARDHLIFMVIGATTALLVRAHIGPGQNQNMRN